MVCAWLCTVCTAYTQSMHTGHSCMCHHHSFPSTMLSTHLWTGVSNCWDCYFDDIVMVALVSVNRCVTFTIVCCVTPLTTHCIDVDGLETRPTLQYTCHLGAPTVHLYTVSVHRAPVYTAPLYRHLSCNFSGGSESPWWHDQAAQECQHHENITSRVGR